MDEMHDAKILLTDYYIKMYNDIKFKPHRKFLKRAIICDDYGKVDREDFQFTGSMKKAIDLATTRSAMPNRTFTVALNAPDGSQCIYLIDSGDVRNNGIGFIVDKDLGKMLYIYLYAVKHGTTIPFFAWYMDYKKHCIGYSRLDPTTVTILPITVTKFTHLESKLKPQNKSTDHLLNMVYMTVMVKNIMHFIITQKSGTSYSYKRSHCRLIDPEFDFVYKKIQLPRPDKPFRMLTGRTIEERRKAREHERRGHYRRLASGRRVYVRPCTINKGVGGHLTKEYRLPRPSGDDLDGD